MGGNTKMLGFLCLSMKKDGSCFGTFGNYGSVKGKSEHAKISIK